MKIIKPGRVRDEWPVGVPLRCDRCGCEFQLDRNDMMLNWKVVGVASDYASPHTFVMGTCPQPGCGSPVHINK